MADENENSCDKFDDVKPDKMFTLKKWNAVAMWSWDVECDTCAICRVQVMVPKRFERFYMLNDSGLMLATELMRRTRPIILRSMSSSDLPCVSGTYTITNSRPTIQIEPNIQNAP
uniref:Anaphase-promoting complex subunit 11 RING-H2 finger domain-containing protein n=1 Tax=Anopheles melas TaxID=34690 RepID=A0A182U5U2_9DIPT